jgi:hypothetical protein
LREGSCLYSVSSETPLIDEKENSVRDHARLKALEEIERDGIAGLVELLREEGVDGVRYALWDATSWHRDYSPPAIPLCL